MYIYIHVYTYILTYLTLPYLTLHYITLHYIHTQIYIYCIHFCPYVQPNESADHPGWSISGGLPAGEV